MAKKSIWNQAFYPETYIDGYGQTREMNVSPIAKGLRAVDRFLNGKETVIINGEEVPVMYGSGSLELLMDPAVVIGKVDDAAKLAKNLRKVVDKWDDLARYKLRRKVNSTPKAQQTIANNVRKKLSKTKVLGPNGPEPYSDILLDEFAMDETMYRILGEPGKIETLIRNRKLDPIAKAYNNAVFVGNLDEASRLKQELQNASRISFDDPYTNVNYWEDLYNRLNNPKNGGSGKKYGAHPIFNEELPF